MADTCSRAGPGAGRSGGQDDRPGPHLIRGPTVHIRSPMHELATVDECGGCDARASGEGSVCGSPNTEMVVE
ncbi:hypothetical protein E2562_017699 [Oryza meyeriana var. granulata]|uniref:Uncharacterized protein n=1 Tax=Oryza meyeriana var. granulata TaxID=110450 RepID=A0A6G1BYJ7_9ORYZ|nr:hypothetical protein E2562_017699 [Oryza meyeriana var. granulata]